MSCLALTLTRKSRPQWMQTVLQNDVRPAQYEGEIARLNAQLASLQRQHREQQWQLQDMRFLQRFYCDNMTLQEYSSRYDRMQHVLQRTYTVLSTAEENLATLWRTRTATPVMVRMHNIILDTAIMLETEDNFGATEAIFEQALNNAQNIVNLTGA